MERKTTFRSRIMNLIMTLLVMLGFIKLDKKGEVNAGEIIGVIIAIALAVIMISAMFPSAMDTFYGTNTTAWTIDGAEDTSTTGIWYMIPLLGVVAGLMIFVAVVIKMVK